MTSRKAFFDTQVPASRSRDAIEQLLRTHGVEASRWTRLSDREVVEFKHPEGSFAIGARYEMADARTPEARERQVLRALHWHIKAKFDAVDFGLADMVQEFLPYLITAPNRVLIDDVREARDKRELGIDMPLLPEGR